MTASITLAGLNHRFDKFHALNDINLHIEAGEYVTLLGPSGCGKTTLLSALGGIVTPSEGTVTIGGRDMTHVPPAKRPTTTMFQDYALFPHMTLRDNVAFGLRMAGVGRRARAAEADEKLALVGLAEAGGRRPHELSGGQRQRVALARALAVEPDVLLLDEPLGALDLKLRRSMQDELKILQRKIGTTFVHVTHDQEEAMALADRIVVMNAGRIEDEGTPDRIYAQPRSLFAADFMGEMNHIPGQREGAQVATALGAVAPVPDGSGDRFTVCIRPEAIKLEGGEIALGNATMERAAFFGTHCRAHLRPDAAPEMALIAHLPPEVSREPGAQFQLHVAADAMTVFPLEAS